jgi:hypothetical protein
MLNNARSAWPRGWISTSPVDSGYTAAAATLRHGIFLEMFIGCSKISVGRYQAETGRLEPSRNRTPQYLGFK